MPILKRNIPLVDCYILRDNLIIQESKRDSYLLTVSFAFNALFYRFFIEFFSRSGLRLLNFVFGFKFLIRK